MYLKIFQLRDKMRVIGHLSVTSFAETFPTDKEHLFLSRFRSPTSDLCAMVLSKPNLGLCNSLHFVSLVISVLALSLLFAGFLRIEIKLQEQEARVGTMELLCRERTQDASRKSTANVESQIDLF